MGCKTCKDKKEPTQNGVGGKRDVVDNKDTINLIPEEIANGDFSGNFLFKLIAFIVMIFAIPLIIVVLIGKMFFTFFMPKSLPKVSKKLSGLFMGIIKRYGNFLAAKEVRKRKKQFEKNLGYEEGSELNDIEDYSDINVHKKNNEKE